MLRPGMNIAILGTRGIPANYGGFETCAEQLSERWAAWGHNVVLYARKDRYEKRPTTVNGVSVRYTSSFSLFGLETPSATFLATLNLIFRGRQFRWIHLYNTGNAFLLPLLRALGFRVVVSVDGIEWRRKKWGWVQRSAHKLGAYFAARLADRVVVDNDAVADFYAERFRCATATIAYGAQPIVRSDDAHEILSRFGLKPDGYCIFIGRIVPEKGVRELINAYEQLKTDLALVIVGDDPRTAYRDEIWARQSDRVRLVGYQYGRVCDQLLGNARMYVSASMLEGTSPSLLSAMSAGVCCLVNGIPENRSTAGGSVAMYEQNDAADLVRIWQALLDDPERRASLAASGQAHQRRFYDWDVIARRYIELFDEVERARSQAPEAAT
jgi:glycosyltransferase involved in cell wall biosynthesis